MSDIQDMKKRDRSDNSSTCGYNLRKRRKVIEKNNDDLNYRIRNKQVTAKDIFLKEKNNDTKVEEEEERMNESSSSSESDDSSSDSEYSINSGDITDIEDNLDDDKMRQKQLNVLNENDIQRKLTKSIINKMIAEISIISFNDFNLSNYFLVHSNNYLN